MAYAVGIVLFALGILISVALHEAGHMWPARAFGMKVTRYFIGFGPTLFAFRRKGVEYGLKAIPAGAFVKIVGMTPQDDDVEPGDEHRAMWRYPVWKRTIVLSGGSIMHFIIGFLLLWITASFVGMPNPALADPQPAVITVQPCVIADYQRVECSDSDPVSPAKKAGLQDGDKVVKVEGNTVATWEELLLALRSTRPGAATLLVERNGQLLPPIQVDLVEVDRPETDGTLKKRAALGVGFKLTIPEEVTYGPVDGFGEAIGFTGDAFVGTWQSMKKIPEKLPKLWHALMGEERDPETPISVVGASRLGGETVERDRWSLFLLILATLNFFIGVFNLLPLLPLDGGHIAIIWFEKVRAWVYGWFKKPDPGRVDYFKLMPLTYVVILIFGGFTLLTVAADIVNPVTIFGR
ncbi:Zn-dependent protease [Virgisporangium aliadipatigenens]|uniref:Zn-dependent protease n=1 Tax=Virgisporangium aliadipatigenens TaxID=741659 RepID=A0A8J3YIF0_9ACTN|nr:site-2 protease family protein [Virgisporangium aliadipatigenens]GIJ45844.1 Zn-dependent protease [Virgisporangium aliadipatigenens]